MQVQTAHYTFSCCSDHKWQSIIGLTSRPSSDMSIFWRPCVPPAPRETDRRCPKLWTDATNTVRLQHTGTYICTAGTFVTRLLLLLL
jgi:hypothetical protein